MKKLKLDELGRITTDRFREVTKIPICLVLDNIRSLHNVGAAFRTADAFRVEKIYLTGITGKPPHREIHKTALGATESVAWEYVQETGVILNRLKANGYTVGVIEQTDESVSIQKFSFEKGKKYCLVFGNEVNGVGEDALALTDFAVEVPQAGTKHSLNISVCLGIVVWEVFKQTYLLKM